MIQHLDAGLPLVDSRSERAYREATIAGPAAALHYYCGGMHDRLTLGLPVVRGA